MLRPRGAHVRRQRHRGRAGVRRSARGRAAETRGGGDARRFELDLRICRLIVFYVDLLLAVLFVCSLLIVAYRGLVVQCSLAYCAYLFV